jgi:hypothetical protein
LRALVLTASAALPLGVAAAANASESYGGHHGDDDASVDSSNDATNSNTQSAEAETNQFSLSNSGFNSSSADVEGSNSTSQEASADAYGGNIGEGHGAIDSYGEGHHGGSDDVEA